MNWRTNERRQIGSDFEHAVGVFVKKFAFNLMRGRQAPDGGKFQQTGHRRHGAQRLLHLGEQGDGRQRFAPGQEKVVVEPQIGAFQHLAPDRQEPPPRIAEQMLSRRLNETPEVILLAKDYRTALAISTKLPWAKVVGIAAETSEPDVPASNFPAVVNIPGFDAEVERMSLGQGMPKASALRLKAIPPALGSALGSAVVGGALSMMLALPDEFLPQGKASDILKDKGLDAAGIAKAVFDAVKGRVASERSES